MSMTQDQPTLKSEKLVAQLAKLEAFLSEAFHEGTAVHQVELGIWQQLLQIGRQCLKQFLALHGSGDLGPTVTLPHGEEHQRLEQQHQRRYVSIFGEFQLSRTVYGSREGQKIAFVPLDNRLQLPASVFSYVLQDWDQALCVEEAFGQCQATVARMLGLEQAVGSLEQMNQEMAREASSYILSRPVPPAEEEGEIIVAGADGKGVVMRRRSGEPAAKAYRTKGDKASQKRMATVGTVYSVDRYVRTPEQVVAALFRDEPQRPPERPPLCHKQVWASLPQEDGSLSGQEAVFTWLGWELQRRNPGQQKETVYLCDGQEVLWQAVAAELPGAKAVPVLDLLHVTPRLWQAAHVFYPEKSAQAEAFVRQRLLRVLRGEAAGVIRGLRALGTRRGVKGNKKKTLGKVCGYLKKNLSRMRYDEYLKAGYPIASGVLEGACRHLVKDRLERAGMHWTAAGAQAMLDLRSLYVSGQWEEYQECRIGWETKKLYPHREAAEPILALAP